MPQSSTSSSVRAAATSPLGRELRSASRRELATLKRDLRDKHRERMKRVRTASAASRRSKTAIAALETGGAAAVAGLARSYLGTKLDVGSIPLELPVAIVGHFVAGYAYSDEASGEHVHNLSNGLLAVAVFQGSQRMTAWARERMRGDAQSAANLPAPPAVPSATSGAYPYYAEALPAPPSLALPPPVLPAPVYAGPTAMAGALPAPIPTAADRAMAEAIRVMEAARQG